MTPEERAEKLLNALVGYQTTMGRSGGAGPEHDRNDWKPAGDYGQSYLVVLAALRDAVAAERERCARIAETEREDRVASAIRMGEQ